MPNKSLLRWFSFFLLIGACVSYSARIRVSACSTPLTSTLDFGEGIQGDLSKTVPAQTADNSSNGCFRVTGDANAYYTFNLSSSITLSRQGGGGILSIIQIYSQTTSGQFRLNSSGSQYVYIGGTRQSISMSQASGTYQGTLSATVRYTSGGLSFSSSISSLAKVIKILMITSASDLNFGDSVAGDLIKMVFPGNVENTENGSFLVQGEPSRQFQIILPSSSVTMVTGNGVGSTKQIQVFDFKSNPAQSSTLDSSGSKTLLIGATRASILFNQVSGGYQGTYLVSVIY